MRGMIVSRTVVSLARSVCGERKEITELLAGRPDRPGGYEMRPQIVKVAMAVAILLSFVGRSTGGNVRYTVTDLGALPGFNYYSQATSINNNGQVVGTSMRSSDHASHAFLWQRDTGLQDLGTLGGTSADTKAMDINNCGQIVGYSQSGVVSQNDPHGHHVHAFFWQNGSGMHDILNDDGYQSQASAINDNGQVTGVYRADDCDGDPSDPHAFLWQNGGTPQIFAPLFQPTGINNAGQVVGSIAHAGQNGAFIWQNSTGLQNIGILPGDTYISTTRINDKGQVVGYSSTATGLYHSFLWQQDSGMQDLGSLGSGGGYMDIASDINNKEQVVGSSYHRAFLWQSGAGMVDLNTLIDPSSGLTLSWATGINDNGWIVGSGVNSSGQYSAFLLTPTPEPSTLMLIGIAAVSLTGHARRRRRAT